MTATAPKHNGRHFWGGEPNTNGKRFG